MQKSEDSTKLNRRAQGILRALIREHVRTGSPVGSRRLAKEYREHLSPATIRNVVADLEEMGYVEQPHTSAGRVPTAMGYRFYVDSLLERRELSDREVDRIRESLENEADPDELMSKASQLLSSFSDNLGFVIAPPLSRAVMKRMEFVRIAPNRILVIVVTNTGLVQHRLVSVEKDLQQLDLDQAGRYLVTHFSGETLPEIRDQLLALMSEEKALYDRILRNVILLGTAGLMQETPEEANSGVYLGGASHLIQKPELADVQRLTSLFETFEEKSFLVRIITECIRADHVGPTVTIGLDQYIPGMKDWALISSPYHCDHQVMGSLGILGPSRMEYDRAISLVDYVAKLFGRILSSN